MRQLVVGVLVLSCLGPVPGLAQSAQPEQRFAYCSVNDTGGRNIWVSQIFPAPPNTDPLGSELATEFHAYVGTLGGAGDKQCVVSSRQALEDLRVKIAGIMGKRTFGIRVYKWHDVQWTPGPAAYARSAPAPAVAADKYVYCRTTDADARKMVTTAVFTATLPPANDAGRYATLERYARAFAGSAAAIHGVAPGALCIASDTQAEADKSLVDYQHAFPFSGIKKIEMAWRPDPSLASPPAAAAPQPPVLAQSSVIAAPAATPAAAGANDDVEAEFWRRISSSGQAADFDDYLAAFPQGRHAPIARLEARRLRAGGTANVAAPSVAATAQAAPASPVDEALSRRIATEKFFQVPAGTGVGAERTGTRTVGTVRVATTTRMQRVPGGNLCQLHNDIKAGNDNSVSTVFEGLTWAGLLPLGSNLQSRSAFGTSDYAIRVTSIDALQGQPFPLVEGNTFGYTFTQATLDPKGARTDTTMSQQCTVGATGPASATVAGLAGEQTELKCQLKFQDPGLHPQKQVAYWYSAVGCFIQDPGR